MVYVRSTPISICDCDGKVRAIALRGYGRHIGNATASLKSPTAPTNYYQSSNWYSSSAGDLCRIRAHPTSGRVRVRVRPPPRVRVRVRPPPRVRVRVRVRPPPGVRVRVRVRA